MPIFRRKKQHTILTCPTGGRIVPLGEIPDPVFATGTVGQGCAIDPSDGTFTSPVDGELILVARTGHAFAVRADDGTEVLVHIGIDTVQLKGDGFTVLATAGQHVRQGEPIIQVDLALVRDRVPSLISPVLVSNHAEHPVEQLASGQIHQGEPLLSTTS